MKSLPTTACNPQSALAAFGAATRFEALPPGLVKRLKWSVLDTLGCALYGSKTPWAAAVATVAAQAGAGASTLYCAGRSVAAPQAAMANATMVHSFEIDDIHSPSRSHPGGVTIPVALALAQEAGPLSGRDFLSALAVGYEVTARVGMAQGVSSFNRGWHPTGTAGVFGAAATAARVLSLDAARTSHALGIAGTMPAGLMAAQFGAMVKRFYAGHAAWAGLTAARLAQAGLSGISDVFDAGYGGYLQAVSDEIDIERLTDRLGQHFEGESIGYKFHSCVGTNLTALDALQEIRARRSFASADVECVTVTTSPYQVLHSGWPYEPGTVMAAQMNLQFCIALLLSRGKVFVDAFTDETIRDPELLALARRVQVVTRAGQPDADRTADVVVRLSSGEALRASCRIARGSGANPPEWADIEAKFRSLASHVISDENQHRIITAVHELDELADVALLPALCA